MQFPAVRVPPDPRYTAEVVILLTTLGARRTEYNAGKRARDLLEIKRVHHKIIDFNRDARQAGPADGSKNRAIQKLMVEEKLKQGEDNDLILPQIFIDGEFIGDANELQGLEDDGLLDAILVRKACMSCNATRIPDLEKCSQCSGCWVKFAELLPGEMEIQQALEELAGGGYGDYEDDDDDEYSYYEEEEEEEEVDGKAQADGQGGYPQN